MTLGEKLRALRATKNISQPEFAAQIGIEQSYLSKLENDKSVPSNDILRAILQGFGMSLDELLSEPSLQSDYSRLRQIPDVEAWFSRRRQQQMASQRRILYISCALIVAAVCCFYTGFSKQVFPETLYEYESPGVVLEGETGDVFRNWRDSLNRDDPEFHANHEALRLQMQARSDYKVHTSDVYLGSVFEHGVANGKRVYRLDKEYQVPRRINALLQVLGIGLLTMGLLGFVLERRINA